MEYSSCYGRTSSITMAWLIFAKLMTMLTILMFNLNLINIMANFSNFRLKAELQHQVFLNSLSGEHLKKYKKRDIPERLSSLPKMTKHQRATNTSILAQLRAEHFLTITLNSQIYKQGNTLHSQKQTGFHRMKTQQHSVYTPKASLL